jgi:hypothetical protein
MKKHILAPDQGTTGSGTASPARSEPLSKAKAQAERVWSAWLTVRANNTAGKKNSPQKTAGCAPPEREETRPARRRG